MIALSSTAHVLDAMHRARSIAFTAYVLRPGRVLDALDAAARRGARVTVRLEAQPYGDTSGALKDQNAAAVAELERDGADARLADADGTHPLHMKSARIDGALYLDDRNWPDDGVDTIVRDTDSRDAQAVSDAMRAKPTDGAPLATQKDAALRREARSIYHAAEAHQPVAVESESFGFGRVYAALTVAARQHVPVRLLVAQRDVTARSEPALRRLAGEGVAVRLSQNDEKMAVCGDQAWLGSANATAGRKDQMDWGLRIFDPAIVSALKRRFEQNWNAATDFRKT